AAGRHHVQHQPGGNGFIDDDGVVGQQMCDGLAGFFGGQFAARASRALGGLQYRRGSGSAHGRGQFFQAGGSVLFRSRQGVHSAGIRHQIALFARVSEERYRRFALDQNQVLDVGQLHASQLGQIGQAFYRRQTGAAFNAGGEGFGQNFYAAVGGQFSGGHQARFTQRAATQQQSGFFAGADGVGNGVHHLIRRHRRFGLRWYHAGHSAFSPGDVGRQNQGGDTARIAFGGDDGVGYVLTELSGAFGGAHKTGGDVAGHGFNIGLQLGIVLHVVSGVIADDVDHRHFAFAGV